VSLLTEDADETLFVPLRTFAFFYGGLTGCEVIGDIFKAGVWTGVLLVILVIGITSASVSPTFLASATRVRPSIAV
jgi:hypothetical protein